MTAFGITIFPCSWAFGVWTKPHKTIIAFGPVRLVGYRTQAAWKQEPVK